MPLLYRLVLLVFLASGSALAQGAPPPLTRIAFGSCADEEKPQPIWDAVLAYRPELFLFLATTSMAMFATAAMCRSRS
jgi:alkaline phosphatase D